MNLKDIQVKMDINKFDLSINNSELDQLHQRQDYNEESEKGFKCGEAYYFSNKGAIHIRCTLCDIYFEYGNEDYLKHIIECHFNSFVFTKEPHDSKTLVKSENWIKNETKSPYEKSVGSNFISFNTSTEIKNLTIKTNETKQILEENIVYRYKNNKDKFLEEDKKLDMTITQKIHIFKCSYCNEEFRSKTNLMLHKKEHSNFSNVKTRKDGLICEQCGRKFIHRNTLESHYEIAHNPNRKLFPCNECKKSFTSSESLIAHNRHYHTKELPYACEVENCTKRYASLKGLKYHQGKHSNTIYSCTECNKQYSHKNKLQIHYKRHHSVGKIYHCEQCDKSFYDRYFLKKHMICHTNERPFLCDQCPANFPRQKALVAHKKIHSGIRDEICKLCDQAFNLYEGLYQHMKIRHGIKYYRGMTLDDMREKEKLNISLIS